MPASSFDAPDPTDPPALAALEARVGHHFADQALLLAALTHRSYLNEAEDPTGPDNERLEFLGDALLDLLTADHLFRTIPEAREGVLTALRASLVCQATLATFAARLGLGALLRLGRGEAAGGSRQRPSVLADAFEALVGALYLDAGLDAARAFVLAQVAPELAAVLAERRMQDAKSRFQELAQGRWQETPRYATVAEAGPDHDKRFVVEVRVGEAVWGAGEGPSKAAAARGAAVMALQRFEALAVAEAEGA